MAAPPNPSHTTFIRHNIATAVHTRRHVKVIKFINVSSTPNSVYLSKRQPGNPGSRANQLPYLHPGCCSLSLSAPTSRHRKHKAGTHGQTLTPHTLSSPPWRVHRNIWRGLDYRATLRRGRAIVVYRRETFERALCFCTAH